MSSNNAGHFITSTIITLQHFATLHQTTLHYTYRHFTSSHLHFTTLPIVSLVPGYNFGPPDI